MRDFNYHCQNQLPAPGGLPGWREYGKHGSSSIDRAPSSPRQGCWSNIERVNKKRETADKDREKERKRARKRESLGRRKTRNQLRCTHFVRVSYGTQPTRPTLRLVPTRTYLPTHGAETPPRPASSRLCCLCTISKRSCRKRAVSPTGSPEEEEEKAS